MSQTRQTMSDSFLVPVATQTRLMVLAEEHPDRMIIPPHRHDVDQLIYAAQGVLTVDTDNGMWVVPPARGVWVPAGTHHSITMSGPVHLQSVYLQPGVAPLDTGQCTVVHITALLRATILRAAQFDYPYPDGGPEAHIEAVLVDELIGASVAPLNLALPTDPRARAVALDFLADPSDRRPRHQWATGVGASERTLERLFHREVGTTFGRWQQQARLLHALRLLAEGRSVTRTALDVGFDTPSAFIAMFRSAMGTTPGRYFDPPPR